MMSTNYGAATEAKIAEVLDACERYGRNSIIALSGVPGTGKSFIASIAAQRFASNPLMVREIQFHPTYSYEEFLEGYRANAAGGFSVEKGSFLEWNDLALDDSGQKYLLLIEELTRANLPSVLGELMTYIEHRDRQFAVPYSRRPVRIAENLTVLATLNPRDRSALDMDEAIIRRLRLLSFPPDTEQLVEMLAPARLPPAVVERLVNIFQQCEAEHEDDYETLMPFGHGIFAGIAAEMPDLDHLWKHRIKPLLEPPGRRPHPFRDTIAANYPWKDGQHLPT